MPLTFQIDHEHRLVRARATGTLTDDDVFGYQRDAWTRPEVSGYDEIVDMSDVEHIALPSFQRIRDLANLSTTMDAPGVTSRLAIVAPGDVAYMLGKLYKAIRGVSGGARQVGVFRTGEEAEAFLRRADEAAPRTSSGAP